MAKKIVSVKYGCFKNGNPREDVCVFDAGECLCLENCEEAARLIRARRDRGTCKYWRLT